MRTRGRHVRATAQSHTQSAKGCTRSSRVKHTQGAVDGRGSVDHVDTLDTMQCVAGLRLVPGIVNRRRT